MPFVLLQVALGFEILFYSVFLFVCMFVPSFVICFLSVGWYAVTCQLFTEFFFSGLKWYSTAFLPRLTSHPQQRVNMTAKSFWISIPSYLYRHNITAFCTPTIMILVKHCILATNCNTQTHMYSASALVCSYPWFFWPLLLSHCDSFQMYITVWYCGNYGRMNLIELKWRGVCLYVAMCVWLCSHVIDFLTMDRAE